MTGDWLTVTGRALLHEDTFELMVAPAIADLQFEPTAAAYTATVASMLGAVAEDFCGDIRVVAEDVPTLASLVAIQVSYYACMLLLLVAHMSAREALTTLASGASPQFLWALTLLIALSLFPTLLCFWPARRVTRTDD